MTWLLNVFVDSMYVIGQSKLVNYSNFPGFVFSVVFLLVELTGT